jgi:predicted flap endonuclease-1-like 5' DNA nuclease
MDIIKQNLELLNNFKNKLNEFISVKNELVIIYLKNDMKSELNSLNFKLRSYSKWNKKINDLITNLNHLINNQEIKDNSDLLKVDLKDHTNIKALKLTLGLQKKFIEFSNTNDLVDIVETRQEITTLNNKESNSNSNLNSNNNNDDDDNNDNININQNPELNSTKKIDTSKIEAIPKNMAHESRPKDKVGGMIYDLKLVTGIGGANAKKLAEAGISLELLIQEWTQFVQKDPNNSILMLSKMGKPNRFSDLEWANMDGHRRHKYLMDSLKGRLSQETKYLSKLNHHQLIGIKYFDDISKKIPREEIIIVEKLLKKIILDMSKDFIVTICGSYRRGRPRSGDIDTLITHTQIKNKKDLENNGQDVLTKIVFMLEHLGFLVDHLTEESTTKYMGVCICPKKGKIARRIDIRLVPYESYGAAILYFTGSKNFNTTMRTHALHKGYKLSEYGLFKMENGKEKEQVICPEEKDIFKVLDYQYAEPPDRDI